MIRKRLLLIDYFRCYIYVYNHIYLLRLSRLEEYFEDLTITDIVWLIIHWHSQVQIITFVKLLLLADFQADPSGNLLLFSGNKIKSAFFFFFVFIILPYLVFFIIKHLTEDLLVLIITRKCCWYLNRCII